MGQIFVKAHRRGSSLVKSYSRSSAIRRLKASRNLSKSAQRVVDRTFHAGAKVQSPIYKRNLAELNFQRKAQKRIERELKKKIAAGYTNKMGPSRLGTQKRLFKRYGLKAGPFF